jgi:uncharacterized protein (DUF305 family)
MGYGFQATSIEAVATPASDVVRRLTVFIVAALVGGLCFAGGMLLGSRLGTPGDDSAEAGFARDMATHHAQAVEMSFVVRDQSTDGRLRTLASDIIVTQSAQRGMFMGWLQQWSLPQASARPRMAWMPGHAHTATTDGAVLMHGMASDVELRRLGEASGVNAEVLFLQLMIRHHEGGVVMARAIMALSDRREIVRMAQAIEDSQRAEITQMRDMLDARGGRPLASLLE